jgi:hypothetical protein
MLDKYATSKMALASSAVNVPGVPFGKTRKTSMGALSLSLMGGRA